MATSSVGCIGFSLEGFDTDQLGATENLAFSLDGAEGRTDGALGRVMRDDRDRLK
jgi:hypothetical protein